jgi:hypothetical protein
VRLHRPDNLAAYVEGSMTNFTRSFVLSLMIVLASTLGAFIINSLLAVYEQSAGLPLATIYAPSASFISNVIASNAISNQKALQTLDNLRNALIIQSIIFFILVFFAARLALLRPNLKSASTALLFSLVVIPGIAIREALLPIFLHSPIPEYYWALLASPKAVLIVLQVILSVPFYALLFFGGAAILTDSEPAKAQSRSPLTG